MQSRNADVREAVKTAGLKLWEVGVAAGYASDSVFSRKLRFELSVSEKQKIFDAIKILREEATDE
ncbi:MAG: hypothetical protein FWG88_07040 [Oscillospiraceae bacterium]|nr:hypothetical protein [Oscillospiraceae bacterium]